MGKGNGFVSELDVVQEAILKLTVAYTMSSEVVSSRKRGYLIISIVIIIIIIIILFM